MIQALVDRNRERVTTRPIQIAKYFGFFDLAHSTTPYNLPAMADTIFKKIIDGSIPSHKIYEDEKVLAFLDVGPLSPGHALVIPKEPAETLDTLSDESAAAIGRVLPRISRAIMKATGASAYNILQNNGPLAHQAVMHVHFHIIPKYDDGRGLSIEWPAKDVDHEAAKVLAEKIVGELG